MFIHNLLGPSKFILFQKIIEKEIDPKPIWSLNFRASLVTQFFYEIFNFLRENKLISHGKMKNHWEIAVSKSALIV